MEHKTHIKITLETFFDTATLTNNFEDPLSERTLFNSFLAENALLGQLLVYFNWKQDVVFLFLTDKQTLAGVDI